VSDDDDTNDDGKHSHALAPEEHIRFRVKAELRKRMRGVRKTAPLEACAERSAKIIAALEAHPSVKAAKTIALFWPMIERHEVDLRVLDAAMRARGGRVAYPSLDQDTNDMTFRFVVDDEANAMEDAGYGFAEPHKEAENASSDGLDVIIVPALAIDPIGHRIGYGAGYYDRTIPKFAPPAVTIAVAFDYQLVAEVPFTPGDVRVDWVVTDSRVLDAKGDKA
jgi:5-formyltetrahydrofolate cyclo-ligase